MQVKHFIGWGIVPERFACSGCRKGGGRDPYHRRFVVPSGRIALDPQPKEFVEDPETLPAFQAMRVAATGRPERSMGDSVIAAELPRWSEVRTHAADLASGAMHLEILTTLVRAGLALDGLGGLQGSLADMADTLEQQWAAIFPEPDEDDPDDRWYARSNLLVDLAAEPGFRDALMRTPLVSVRGVGEFSARDLDVAAGLVDGSEEERARCQSGIIDGAFAEAPAEALGQTAEALRGSLDACQRIGAVLEREIGAGATSNTIAPIVERLSALRARFQDKAGGRLATSSDADAANDPLDGSEGSPSGRIGDATSTDSVSVAGDSSSASTLADHEAVRAALDGVVRYYVRNEPGSPVAVLAAHTRELVGRGFFELVGTLCPETEYGNDLVTRLDAPRRDPVVTLLTAGFGNHLAGSAAFDPSDYASDGTGSADDASALGDDAAADAEGDAWTDAESVDGAVAGDAAHGLTEADEGSTRDAPGRVATTSDGETARAAVPATRADVLRVLDQVLAFYRVQEPSSPVPLVLARVRALVPLDFEGVLDALRKALAANTPSADTEAP